MLRYSNFEPSFKLRWCRARDLFGSKSRKVANSGTPDPPNLLGLMT